jgi:hypothetical protein
VNVRATSSVLLLGRRNLRTSVLLRPLVLVEHLVRPAVEVLRVELVRERRFRSLCLHLVRVRSWCKLNVRPVAAKSGLLPEELGE